MEIAEIKKLLEKVDGWISDEEGELLFNLAKNCKGKGVIVEIGSWKGRSTIWLGLGSKQGSQAKVYAVDPHTGSKVHTEMYGKVWTFDEFKMNIKMANLSDVVIPVVKTSAEAAKNFNMPVELIFIDGDHEYDAVKLDFDLWFPKLVDGGIMAFDDTVVAPGPKKVVDEFLYKSKNFGKVKTVGKITFAQKVRQNSLRGMLVNRLVLVVKNAYISAGKLPFPKPFRAIGRKLIRLIQ